MKPIVYFASRGVVKGFLLPLVFVLVSCCIASSQVQPQPVVNIRAADGHAAEPCTAGMPGDRGVFVISRTSYTNLDLYVQVAIAGTATNGVDYEKIPARILIPKGKWAAEIPVCPLLDAFVEPVESVVLRIMPVACIAMYPPPPECYLVGQQAQAVMNIADCAAERPVISIRAVDPRAVEPCDSSVPDKGLFVIHRSAATNITMLVNVAISGVASNGLDYVRITNRIQMPAGVRTVEVPVLPLRDKLAEGPESVVMRILPPFCPQTVVPLPPVCYQIGQPAEAMVYITDCPVPSLVRITRPEPGQVFPESAKVPTRVETADPDGYFWKAEFFADTNKIGERILAFLVAPTNGTMIPFEFTWETPPAGKHLLSVRATDNSGEVAFSQRVGILVGEAPPPTNRPTVVNIVATDPVAVEGTNCWGWWNETNRYPVSTAQQPVYSPSVGQPIWWFTNCGPKDATFTIRREGATNEELRVFYAIGGTALNGKDYELLPGSVIIPAGVNKSQVLIVPIEDAVPERVETVVLRLMPPPYASPLPPDYIVGLPSAAGAVIVDSTDPRIATGTLPDRSFYVGKNALEGSWYRIERSSDMMKWEIVCTNQVVQGSVHFVDPDAPDAPKRFYRAVPVPEPMD